MPYTPISLLLALLKEAQSTKTSLNCLAKQRIDFDSPEHKLAVSIGKAAEHSSPGPNPHRIPGHI